MIKYKGLRLKSQDVTASVCRDSYWDFVQKAWHTVSAEKMEDNFHMRLMADKFQEYAERMIRGERKKGDLVVNISPGTTKSTILSILSLPWIWTKFPSCKGIFGSYSYEPVAIGLSVKARDCVQSDWYRELFPEVQLRADQNTKTLFATTAGGFRYCVGVRGSVTGMHGHLIVVDDPLDPNQSVSKSDLEASNRWLKETLPTRKVNKATAVTILVMQRLCEGDPTDLFLKRKRTEHVCLPAELEPGIEPVPKSLESLYVDGLMDPKRLPREVLEEAESDMGRTGYSAQYLQTPAPPEGEMFHVERLKYVEHVPKLVMEIRFWDKAYSEEAQKQRARTCGVKMGKDKDGRVIILDVKKFRADSAKRERIIVRTANADGFDTLVGIEQEGGAGKDSAENTVKNLAGFRVRILKVAKSQESKVERADPFSVQVNNGNVYLLKADWNEEYVRELQYFPRSRLKDQVDASSGGFNMIFRRRRRVGGLSFEPTPDVKVIPQSKKSKYSHIRKRISSLA